MKNKREAIPEYFEGKNIIRFEMRFMKKLSKAFNIQELTVNHLIQPAFFNALCHRWREEYRSIQKNMNTITGISPTGSKPKLLEELAIMQIHQMGIENFLDEIKAWQLTGEITKKEAYEYRKFTKDKAAEKYPLAENESIQEFNQKIKVAARFEV